MFLAAASCWLISPAALTMVTSRGNWVDTDGAASLVPPD